MGSDDSRERNRWEVIERKLGMLHRFIADLEPYGERSHAERRRDHYAVERLLQLLCESAADIGLQMLRARGERLASSYREVFAELRDRGDLPEELAEGLIDACAMRNLLTHLYDTVDLDRVARAVEPAVALYRRYAEWIEGEMGEGSPGADSAREP
ncbi:MAG: type VII toxin-antitoxin system HepT family RNase toxin [Thiohalospira sp.]